MVAADDEFAGLESIAPHVRCLRRVGYWQGGGEHARVHAFYRAAVLALTSLYLLQECIYAHQVHDDITELSRVMFLLLCHVTSLAKQVVLHARARWLVELTAAMRAAGGAAGGVPAVDGMAGQALRWHTARRAALLQRGFAGAAWLTCTLWLASPAMLRTRGIHVAFPFWLPGTTCAPFSFWLALMYQYLVTTLVGVANTTMDAFIATVLYQCQTELRILRLNLESLMKRAEKICKGTKEDLEEVATRLFQESLDHYDKIVRVVTLLEGLFGGALLIQFGISGWILCMAAYKVVSLSFLSIEFASVTLFIFCILLELYLFCYFGNEVTFECMGLVESVFASGWWCGRRGGCSRPRARAVLLFLTRASRPLCPAALRFVPLSLQVFLKILKSSYTFYAVLRQTKEKPIN